MITRPNIIKYSDTVLVLNDKWNQELGHQTMARRMEQKAEDLYEDGLCTFQTTVYSRWTGVYGLNPKWAGLFGPISQLGGGFRPPPHLGNGMTKHQVCGTSG